MFYIEKNDKPSFIQKKLCIVKKEGNSLYIPILEKTTDKQKEKIAQRTRTIIEKNSNSKKVILSKKILDDKTYINYLNTYGIEIVDGKWLYEILATDIVEYIKLLSKKYKTINIVTNHIEKFKKLEKKLLNEDGIIITITNNKKKSLLKSQIILNVDFPQELINNYNINENAIIINIHGKIKINKKRFNGLNVNNYEIDYRDDKKDNICFSCKFYLRDVYEAELFKKENFYKIRESIRKDKVIIKKLILNNGEY